MKLWLEPWIFKLFLLKINLNIKLVLLSHVSQLLDIWPTHIPRSCDENIAWNT